VPDFPRGAFRRGVSTQAERYDSMRRVLRDALFVLRPRPSLLPFVFLSSGRSFPGHREARNTSPRWKADSILQKLFLSKLSGFWLNQAECRRLGPGLPPKKNRRAYLRRPSVVPVARVEVQYEAAYPRQLAATEADPV